MRKILKNKKIYWTVLLCLLLLPGIFPAAVYGYERAAAAYAGNTLSAGQFEVLLECGWKGMSRGGSEVPAAVTIVNSGPEFHGTLKLCVSVESDSGSDVPSRFLEQLFVGVRSALTSRNQTYTYELPVEIPQNGTVKKQLTLALIEYNMTAVVVSLEDQSGNTVYENREEVTTSDIFQSEITVGVLEEESNYASRLNGMEVGTFGYIVRGVSIRPEDLTETMASAGAPDVILLLDSSRGMLDEKQQQNLERWEAQGGMVIDFDDAFFSSWDPSGQLGDTMEQVFRKNPEKMMQIFLTADVVDSLPSVINDGYIQSFDTALHLENNSLRRQPSSVLYICLIVGYAVLAGPVLYLALKRKNKRYYLWAGICGLSVVFVIAIKLLGNTTAMTAPVIVYQNILRQNGSVLEETLDFEIQAPYNSDYTVYLDPSYRMTPGSAQNTYTSETVGTAQEGFEQIELSYGESKNKITFSNQPAFALNAVTLSRDLAMDTEGLVSDLNWTDQGISGTVSNQTEYMLKDCVLMLPGHMACVGDLEAGETVELNDLEAESVRDSHTWLVDQLGEGDRTDDYSDQAKLWSLNRLDDSLLIAQVADREETFQLYSAYETFGTVLYTANASVNCLDRDGVLYCPYAQQYFSTEQDAFTYRKYPDSLTMSGQQMEVTYFLNAVYEEEYLREKCLAMLIQEIFISPENVEAMEGEELVSSLEYIRSMMEDPEEILAVQQNLIAGVKFQQPAVLAEEWAAFDGKIEVYNYGTGDYEELEDWKLADSSAERGIPSPYLRNGNQLKVRYTLTEENISSAYYKKMGTYQMPDLIVYAIGGNGQETYDGSAG